MAQHMAQQNAEGSRDLSTLVDASAELQHLVQTIWRLRQPDGCPWDREQTHQSIGKNMIEEAYEALDCIEADDVAHLREELGDVLMQVVLHAQIAADAGEFTLADVARDIDAKLIRRHPHVFGDADADRSDEVLKIWAFNVSSVAFSYCFDKITLSFIALLIIGTNSFINELPLAFAIAL